MQSIISYENGDGSLHTVASVDAADVQGVIERSGAYTPVELSVRDLSTPDGFDEAVDDVAVAKTVQLTQTGQKLGRSLTWEAIEKFRHDSKSSTFSIEPVERARDLGQVVVSLTAPTQEALEAILPVGQEV